MSGSIEASRKTSYLYASNAAATPRATKSCRC